MGLRETLRNVAQTAITATGNIAVSGTYRSTGAPTYNPATGEVTSNDTDYDSVPIIYDDNAYTSLGRIDIPNISVDQNERLFYIAQLDLTPTPEVKDKIIISSVEWEVIDIKTDPADALWIIKGKKS